MPRRKKNTNDMNDPGTIMNAGYNPWSASSKVSPVDLKLVPTGLDLTTVQHFDQGSMIALYNSDTVVHYAASNSGGTAPSAPTSGANGVALPPGEYFYYQMGDDQNIILDAGASGKVYAYTVLDDVLYTSDKNAANS